MTARTKTEMTTQDHTSDLSYADALRIARGCTDYGGGHRGDPARFEAYQDGIQTVITALTHADPKDSQTRALMAMGAQPQQPAGWRLVPVEPTQEWIDAAGEKGLRIGSIRSLISDVLACAPAHPSQQEDKPPARTEGAGDPVDQQKWDAAFKVVSAYLRERRLGADMGQVAALCDVVMFATEQQEDNARDAKRYRWLKQSGNGGSIGVVVLHRDLVDDDLILVDHEADAAIDAAMSDSAGEGGNG